MCSRARVFQNNVDRTLRQLKENRGRLSSEELQGLEDDVADAMRALQEYRALRYLLSLAVSRRLRFVALRCTSVVVLASHTLST